MKPSFVLKLKLIVLVIGILIHPSIGLAAKKVYATDGTTFVGYFLGYDTTHDNTCVGWKISNASGVVSTMAAGCAATSVQNNTLTVYYGGYNCTGSYGVVYGGTAGQVYCDTAMGQCWATSNAANTYRCSYKTGGGACVNSDCAYVGAGYNVTLSSPTCGMGSCKIKPN
jgi:hypothetical protein